MQSVQSFINEVRSNTDFANRFYQQFKGLAPGDWAGFAKIAASMGYNFSVADLVKALPDGFFLGMGSVPELGWDLATRQIHKAQTYINSTVNQGKKILHSATSVGQKILGGFGW